MSHQNTGESKVCPQCGQKVSTGSYCDDVYLLLKNGTESHRLLHGGPCTMAFITRTGVDILRQIHPVVPVALVG